MANSLENSIRDVLEKFARALEGATELKVETHYVEIGAADADMDQPRPVARTIIQLDGDYQAILPMRKREDSGTLEQDEELFALHQRHVQEAIQYRKDLLATLLSVLPTRTR
jgi:hypothetical protein